MSYLKATALGSTVALLLSACATSPSAVELDTMRKQSQLLEKFDAVIAGMNEMGRRQATMERKLEEQQTDRDVAAQTSTLVLQLSQRQDVIDCKVTSIAVHERCAVYWHGEKDPEAFSARLKECLVTQNFQDASTCSRPNWVTRQVAPLD